MRLALPGIDLDPYEWVDEQTIRLKGGRYVKLVSKLVTSMAGLKEMEATASASRRVYYDTETSGLHPHLGARVVGHAIGVQTKKDEFTAYYVPIRHFNASVDQLDIGIVSQTIDTILTASGCVVGHHLKFDVSMAKVDRIRVLRTWHDTASMANIYNENERAFGLKELAEEYVVRGARREEEEMVAWMKNDARQLRMNYKKSKDPLAPTYLKRFGYSRTPVKMCGAYACKDVFYTWALDVFYQKTRTQFAEVYRREMRIAHLVQGMEFDGLPVDPSEIQSSAKLVEEEVAFWLEHVRHHARDPLFTPTAPLLRSLFYEQLKLDVPKWTDKGLPAVDKEARELLSKKYPQHSLLMSALSKHAKAEKIRSTYALAFLSHVTPDQRICPSYNQIERKDEGGVPVTGRMNSQDPNIQNVAKKPIHLAACRCKKCVKEWNEAGFTVQLGDEVTISVRRYFTVPKGMVRAYIDLSQIELRVLTWFSQDKRLLYCYANDLDVHQITADEVTGGDRDIAKQVNFGNNYGMTKHGLAKRLTYYASDPERALEDAEKYLVKFFQVYSGIPKFKRRFAEQMRANDGMFVSPFGRPRRIPEVLSDDPGERARGERMMMSSIISGTSADLIKEIAIRCMTMVAREGHEVYLKKAIHDELSFDMPIKGCSVVLPKLMKCFTDWPMFEERGVPIRASCELTTTTWEDKRAITFNPDGSFSWAA